MIDFVCIGDVTQDNFFFLSEEEASLHCQLNTQNCELALKYGQKIPAEKFVQTVGGNAANVAVGLSRQGLNISLVTVFGGDDRGSLIQKSLLKENVNLENSLVDSKRESNNSCILVFKGERTILTYHSNGEDNLIDLPMAKWFYVTSSSGRDSKGLHEKVILKKKNNPDIKIAFNPAVSDIKKGLDSLKPILAETSILILNWSESMELLKNQNLDIGDQKAIVAKEMLRKLSELRPRVVVITDGANGAYAFDGHRNIFCEPARWFQVMETTGAGDAFSSGFLSGFVISSNMDEALPWGMINSGSVVGKPGGQEGLLSAGQIQKVLAEHQEFKVKEI